MCRLSAATLRTEIGEICEFLCDRLDGPGIRAECAMLAECAEQGSMQNWTF
jgi:hypothetical protein